MSALDSPRGSLGGGVGVGYQGSMYLLRAILPDRPGSLGAVATALGAAQADIASVEIVEKAAGLVIDDFVVDLPEGVAPDVLVSACATLEDVEVMWVSFYPQNRTITADVDVLAGLGAAGSGSHAEGETVDLASIPRQALRSAVLIERLSRTPR